MKTVDIEVLFRPCCYVDIIRKAMSLVAVLIHDEVMIFSSASFLKED